MNWRKHESTTFETGDQVKTTSSTYVRLGPGTHYASLGSITKNTQGVLLDHSLRGIYAKGNYWWKGDYSGKIGWVVQGALTLVSQGNLPRITAHPSDPYVCRGDSAIYSVSAMGTGTLTYQWQVNGVDVSDGEQYSGVSTPTFTVLDASDDDVASYRCVVTDDIGSTTSYSAPFTLQAETIITQQPESQTVYPLIGETEASFTLAAGGEGSLSYQWKKDGNLLSDDSHYSGATTPILTIHDVNGTHTGTYRCQVIAGCGNIDSDDVMLTVVSTDADMDLDADLEDFGRLQACLGITDVQQGEPDCQGADLNADNVVKGDDVLLFQGCASGAHIPAAPGC